MKTLLMTLAVLVAALPASAQSTPPPQAQGSGQVLDEMANVVFKEIEKRLIEDYFDAPPVTNTGDGDVDKGGKEHKHKKKDKNGEGRGRGLPPGLAKQAQLPPGLAKRGNHLPHGLMKADLPPELEQQLPPLPANVERVVVDGDVLLIQKGTDLILDVLQGVIRDQ